MYFFRPEADDVNVLRKELVSVQKIMNDLTHQREVEKEMLEKQCNSVQETCIKYADRIYVVKYLNLRQFDFLYKNCFMVSYFIFILQTTSRKT